MTTTLRTVSFWLSCFDFPMQWTALQEVEYRAIGNYSFTASKQWNVKREVGIELFG